MTLNIKLQPHRHKLLPLSASAAFNLPGIFSPSLLFALFLCATFGGTPFVYCESNFSGGRLLAYGAACPAELKSRSHWHHHGFTPSARAPASRELS